MRVPVTMTNGTEHTPHGQQLEMIYSEESIGYDETSVLKITPEIATWRQIISVSLDLKYVLVFGKTHYPLRS